MKMMSNYKALCIETCEPRLGERFTVCCSDYETCRRIVELVLGYGDIDRTMDIYYRDL